MAIRKTELYSSLWASCDELRGGMDASQYKDYVLALLFIKYVSDKYAGKPYADIVVPEGASFADMVKLKGKTDIGDQINKKIVGPLWRANHLNEPPDFDDPNRLGSAKEKTDKLTSLIAIFEDRRLDFTTHRAGDDDLLGDAYEYLMRHFATESGKSKGQFYTPAEVSRIMAKVIGIGQTKTTADTTVYDPTCGSGSLLLRVADEAGSKVSIYGQEKDATTSNLARMNMILHDWAHADIRQGNTLSDPKLKDGDKLKTFDYVVANPPFSDKRWSTGFDPEHDEHGRFAGFGVPPAKQGDYAYLLHIVRSLKSTGVGCCILPHGVLFRGHAEAEIRTNLLKRGYIKGIIGLPPNLFYGTGIPACIVVVDKRDAAKRLADGGGVYMIDASKGFMKDGPKNRLRSRDIHRIVDAFEKLETIDKYARMVPLDEIVRHEYNLNIPRYIDASEPEDLQDIDAHLNGGIPERDIDALERYWAVCPGLRDALFTPRRPGYVDLAVEPGEIRQTIREHPEFKAFTERMAQHFEKWRTREAKNLKAIDVGDNPKAIIHQLSEGLLEHYWGQPLVDAYGVYQILMDYWADVMQDDCYAIAGDGWVAEPRRVYETVKQGKKKGQRKDVGWACDLVPKEYIVARYFASEQATIDELGAKLEQAEAELAEFEEEHGGDDGMLSALEVFTDKAVKERLSELKDAPRTDPEKVHLQAWKAHDASVKSIKKEIKKAEAALDAAALAKYGELGEDDVRALVVDDKWIGHMATMIGDELDSTVRSLITRVIDLGTRYSTILSDLDIAIESLATRVERHLEQMGFAS